MWICLKLKQAGDNESGWLESPYQLKKILRYTKQEDRMPTCLPKSQSWTVVAANSAGFSLPLLTSQRSPLCRTLGRSSAQAQQPPVPGEKKKCLQRAQSPTLSSLLLSFKKNIKITYTDCCCFLKLGCGSPFQTSVLHWHSITKSWGALALSPAAKIHLLQAPTSTHCVS